MRALALRIGGGVFALRVDIGERHLDRVVLVLADAAVEDLLAPGHAVEAPLVLVLDERDRKRPVLVADDEDRAVRAVGRDLMLGIIARDELVAIVLVGNRIARVEDAAGGRAEDLQHPGQLAGLGGGDQRLGSLFGAVEDELGVRRRARRKQRQCRDDDRASPRHLPQEFPSGFAHDIPHPLDRAATAATACRRRLARRHRVRRRRRRHRRDRRHERRRLRRHDRDWRGIVAAAFALELPTLALPRLEAALAALPPLFTPLKAPPPVLPLTAATLAAPPAFRRPWPRRRAFRDSCPSRSAVARRVAAAVTAADTTGHAVARSLRRRRAPSLPRNSPRLPAAIAPAPAAPPKRPATEALL